MLCWLVWINHPGGNSVAIFGNVINGGTTCVIGGCYGLFAGNSTWVCLLRFLQSVKVVEVEVQSTSHSMGRNCNSSSIGMHMETHSGRRGTSSERNSIRVFSVTVNANVVDCNRVCTVKRCGRGNVCNCIWNCTGSGSGSGRNWDRDCGMV